MAKRKEYTNDELVALFHQDQSKAIEVLFRNYYSYVCNVLYPVLKDKDQIEDIAQDVFHDLWKKRSSLQIKTSLSAYLKRAAINKALNHIRGQRMKFDDNQELPLFKSKEVSSQKKLEANELEELIKKSIDELPERCRIIFSLSRHQKLTYNEIAAKLDISVKTVENQISKALKTLRINLKPYISELIVSLLTILLYY